jgi:cell wall-associated NlpC family hydrolase
VLLLAGLSNAPVLGTIRALLRGEQPPSRGSGLTAASTGKIVGRVRDDTVPTAKADAIVTAARRHLGKPYRLGAAGPSAFDCSGLVSYVLQEVGIFPKGRRWVTGQFYVWTGAQTVRRTAVTTGDLICWQSHIAIATSSKRMIHAPSPGKKVSEVNIYWTGSPLVRRIKSG